jgi:hypothetical protein
MYNGHISGHIPRHIITFANNTNISNLTPWSKAHLEKPTAPHLVKKFPAFYGNRRFITAFTTTRHLSICCARSVQSTPRSTDFLEFYFNVNPPIYTYVFQVVSFPQVPPPKPYQNLYSPSHLLRALPILFSLSDQPNNI